MGYQLQYISTTNGAFNSVLAANMTSTSVIESKFLITSSYNGRPVYFGVDYADTCVRAYEKDMYMCSLPNVSISSYLTLNEEHTAYFSSTEYRWNGSKIADVTGSVAIPSSPRFRSQIRGNLYYFKITDNGVDLVNLVAWDEDGTLGVKDLVSGNFYTPSTGTWTAGPRAHVFEPSKFSLIFPASGGSITFDVEAETTWTASTPTFATLSPSTGGTGTTTVTATCPSYTGTTKREETITFTDNDNYTFDVKIRQRALTNGISNLYLGDNQIPTANAIYLGDTGVNTIYLGEEIVYSSGPFVGLKVRPSSLSFTSYKLTNEIKIQSSENWTITDDSGGWLSYSTTSGTTGKTVVTVSATTTQADRTATITVTSANYSATVGVTQRILYYKDLYVTGAANIVTDFNPYTFYTQNNNYMKIVICSDFVSSYGGNKYLFATPANWFSLENYNNSSYFNIGSTTPALNYTNSNGTQYPCELVFQNGTVTRTQNGTTETKTNYGNLPDDTMIFYKTAYSRNYQGHLYAFAVYGANDVLAHWYVGYDDGTHVGIEDLVTGNKFQPNGSNYTIQCSDLQ